MKAVVVHKFGDPDVLKCETNWTVPTLADHQVLVRLHSAGVNPVDTYIRAKPFGDQPHLPYTPGYDGAGVVEKVGAAVKSFKKSDRVFLTRENSGTYAEYCVAEETGVWHLAPLLTRVQGAALGIPYFTAYRALFHLCHKMPGDKVLVHGASGAVGQAVLQIARMHGMEVYGTAGTKEGMEFVLHNNAKQVFNHREKGYVNKIKEAVPGGFNVIMEMVANVNLETARPSGPEPPGGPSRQADPGPPGGPRFAVRLAPRL